MGKGRINDGYIKKSIRYHKFVLAKHDKTIKYESLSKTYIIPNPQYRTDWQTPRSAMTYIPRIQLLP